ncbi:MAG: hypothetical protein ACM3IL_00050 [Deltaproteobacteria bacterium]
MKKIILSMSVTLLILGGVACQRALGWQGTWPPEYREKVTTRVYKMDYDKVFAAVLKVSEESGYPVVTNNKNDGIIVTEYRYSVDRDPGRGQVRLEFFIAKTEDTNYVKVRLDIKFREVYEFGGMASTGGLIDEDDYTDILDKIDKELNKEEPSQGY